MSADLLKLEREAAKGLVEALLTTHGGCRNPSGDGKHDCQNCVFELHVDCVKLILHDWLTILEKGNTK
jgi:hypothetical protein